MTRQGNERLLGILTVLVAAVLWGTTGTAATFAPDVGAVAIGAVAMGGGGLMQAMLSAGRIRHHRSQLRTHWRWLVIGAVAVAIYPLAFYASMRLAGVTIGTVVSIGSAPLLSALIESRLDGCASGHAGCSAPGSGCPACCCCAWPRGRDMSRRARRPTCSRAPCSACSPASAMRCIPGRHAA